MLSVLTLWGRNCIIRTLALNRACEMADTDFFKSKEAATSGASWILVSNFCIELSVGIHYQTEVHRIKYFPHMALQFWPARGHERCDLFMLFWKPLHNVISSTTQCCSEFIVYWHMHPRPLGVLQSSNSMNIVKQIREFQTIFIFCFQRAASWQF